MDDSARLISRASIIGSKSGLADRSNFFPARYVLPTASKFALVWRCLEAFRLANSNSASLASFSSPAIVFAAVVSCSEIRSEILLSALCSTATPTMIMAVKRPLKIFSSRSRCLGITTVAISPIKPTTKIQYPTARHHSWAPIDAAIWSTAAFTEVRHVRQDPVSSLDASHVTPVAPRYHSRISSPVQKATPAWRRA